MSGHAGRDEGFHYRDRKNSDIFTGLYVASMLGVAFNVLCVKKKEP